MIVAAIQTLALMTTVMEEQAYALQVGRSEFDLVSHSGSHTDQNANDADASSH